MLRTDGLLAAVASACVLLFGCGKTETPDKRGKEILEVEKQPVQAPAVFRVNFDTSKGQFVIEVTRDWAPRGADRFYELVGQHHFDGCRFFRVVPRFVVQFGINGTPSVSQLWRGMIFPDDPVKQSNLKGTLSYAMSGPATRTTQVFINLADNKQLDARGFAPFAKVVSGMDVVSELFRGYGDAPPAGVGPDQDRIFREGNEYLERFFPRLDYIKIATVAGL